MTKKKSYFLLGLEEAPFFLNHVMIFFLNVELDMMDKNLIFFISMEHKLDHSTKYFPISFSNTFLSYYNLFLPIIFIILFLTNFKIDKSLLETFFYYFIRKFNIIIIY